MESVVSPEHMQQAQQIKHWLSLYTKNKDLISVGAYVPGNDAHLDRAVKMNELLMAFLRQGPNESIDFNSAVAQLGQIFTVDPNQMVQA